MDHLKLSGDALNVGVISDMASAECCGAISLFVGTTRDYFEGKKVLSLEYQAYETMALKQLKLICEELRQKWPDIVNIVIYHRLGSVGIREASVVIAISAPHRESSLRAVAVAIDELKKRVPIWKKEIYEGEVPVWKENQEIGAGCSKNSNKFNENMCFIEDPRLVPGNLVQIPVPENEIKRRIQCFVEKKRDEINLSNIMDFTNAKQKVEENLHQADTMQEMEELNDDKSMTSARVNSFVVKQEYSKCHLKVRQVENKMGPQTQTGYLDALDKLMVDNRRENKESDNSKTLSNSEESDMLKYSAILERLEDIEEHLYIPPSKIKNIYQRLKDVEDRLLYLESISPEYSNFLVEKSQVNNIVGAQEPFKTVATGELVHENKKYSINEIDGIAQSFEKRNLDCRNSNTID